jgi:hypothetical protein
MSAIRLLVNVHLDVTMPNGDVNNVYFGFGDSYRVDHLGRLPDDYYNIYLQDGRVIKGVQRKMFELFKDPRIVDEIDVEDAETQEGEVEETTGVSMDVKTNLRQRSVEEIIDGLGEDEDYAEIPIDDEEDDEPDDTGK